MISFTIERDENNNFEVLILNVLSFTKIKCIIYCFFFQTTTKEKNPSNLLCLFAFSSELAIFFDEYQSVEYCWNTESTGRRRLECITIFFNVSVKISVNWIT